MLQRLSASKPLITFLQQLGKSVPQDAAGKTVAVAMSGGVDSSVAAYILREQGYRIIGVHMRNWDALDEQGPASCAADRDFLDVQAVCSQLSVPSVQVDFVKEYWHDVFAPSLEAYSSGVTPNPDVLCNRHVKAGVFRDYARSTLGADFVAFGHYARVERRDPAGELVPRLLAGVDPLKDQSYFLSSVTGEQLRDVLFPVGGLYKREVRSIAAAAGLATATKRESMGLCFVGRRRRFGAFLSEYLEPRPGQFVSADDGAPLGPHAGFELYTVGQKAKIGGAECKWFVVRKDARSAAVIVAPGADHPAVFASALRARRETFNWVAGTPPPELEAGQPFRCRCKVRYRQDVDGCVVHAHGEGHWRVVFDEPARAVAPQQQLALYLAGECLGGGPIEEAEPLAKKDAAG